MKAAIERRRHPRYRLSDGAMAVSAGIPGHIKDVSMGGISFVYLYGEDCDRKRETVDILDGQHDFFMEEIPCQVVSKKMLLNGSSFSMIRMMQCSLQFGTLTKAQTIALQGYIRICSAMEAVT